MAKYENKYVKVLGKRIPVRLYREWRSSIRFSIGKKYVIMRIPMVVGDLILSKELEKLRIWVTQKAQEDPSIISRLVPKSYENGDSLTILNKTYTLLINEYDRNNFGGQIDQSKQTIEIKYPQSCSSEELDHATREIIIKLLNRSYLPLIKQRVYKTNDTYFKERIDGIRLKYNTSNWGSCSSKRNINLSTRLLLTTEEVLDYVIVHELSHLKELNHSPRFWSIVEKVMPDYKKHEKWLSTYGNTCYI